MDAALFSAHDVNTELASIQGFKTLADGSNIIWALSRREFGPMSFKNRPKWDVAHNRSEFLRLFGLKLDQLVAPELDHTPDIQIVDKSHRRKGARNLKDAFKQTDGLLTKDKDVVLMTTHADCLPVWLASNKSGWIGVAHAGWKGLLNGVVENLVNSIPEADREDIELAVGPGICFEHYEVGNELAELFRNHPILADIVKTNANGKTALDLVEGVRLIAKSLNVSVDTSMFSCTYENQHLSSYRRDGEEFAPMAAFIVRQG